MNSEILVIDNYDSFTYNLIQIVEGLGKHDCVVLKNDAINLRAIKRYKKILITPGPGVPLDAGEILSVIKRYGSSKCILGICLGHQAIAEAFGGRLEKMPKVVHGIKKRITVVARDEYLFKGIPKNISAGFYHSWAVSKKYLPDCLDVTAWDDDGTIMAIRHKHFDVRGIQFHPESIMTDYGKKIIQNWLNR
ncbi:MAG: aminodeoxychorismate/anthranilate synthase component II [Chlorobiaceae bacterium]|nr:aminodeoxychorismate/anthranilate synthase component II [Chlorobiaceae bacterium]